MFAKVLVANRGEIALRIFRTLRRLGIPSVAVYSDADRESLHVEGADEAVWIGPAPAGESYLNIPALLKACRDTGATAVHPGYGFLSENAGFARTLEAEGIRFIGPTAASMEAFGLKHRARAAAISARVPLLPGTDLLDSLETAQTEALKLGFPIMLKSTGGGGGIGMKICRDSEQLAEAWPIVKALAGRNFKDTGVYLERYVEHARHLEVQVFGDGKGGVAILGDRDCSAQRRHQKVVEEAPAPDLDDHLRAELHEAARRLTASQNYANAGTVEFVYDTFRKEFAFLEVNTRLQVEHTVTEEIFGVDLVEWMLRQAAGTWSVEEAAGLKPQGHAVQVRLYAEDPGRNFTPCEGLVTQTLWPENTRVETALRAGVTVTTNYDPLLAKLIVHAPTRDAALDALTAALDSTRVGGLHHNRLYLMALLGSSVFRSRQMTTRWLADFQAAEPSFEVLTPGTQTTVQDVPGRVGLWMVGIPPSGPMDSLSFRLANRVVGNAEGAAGLEITVLGPDLRFRGNSTVALTGAKTRATLDGVAVPHAQAVAVKAGQVLRVGAVLGDGQRAYLAVAGGIDVPLYQGSRSTFTLGGFGGHGGRALRLGDVLVWGRATGTPPVEPLVPELFSRGWNPRELRVLTGPQGAPDYFHHADLQRLLNADWEVHFNSSRTGVRLIGPTPDWPRTDGGEAGLHPSNLHDNAYAIGALDFTGDMPVLLGPDGPSLGGFVCPFTVINADLWKLGQLKPGDHLRFVAVDLEQARQAQRDFDNAIMGASTLGHSAIPTRRLEDPLLVSWTDADGRPVEVRRAGDRNVLLEVGEAVLDLELRLAIQWWYHELSAAHLPGILDLTPGIRSLQVHFDDAATPLETLLTWLRVKGTQMPSLSEVSVPSRTVWLPLSWDDPSTRLAIEKYTSGVRPDAPWCPWNIEFIRRINGLERWQDVFDIVFGAEYLVLGLGDVYLGAPVATPVDPRHRLVTTKYNPARTWTPENAVGIGGAYLCVYGMEGPGGYQFVGRTVPMWNRWFQTRDFPQPWLLRFFDRIRFYPVTTEELDVWRRDLPLGRQSLKIEEGEFRWKDYQAFLATIEAERAEFASRQKTAFDAERERWKVAGLDRFQADTAAPPAAGQDLPVGSTGLDVPYSGSLWQLHVKAGDRLTAGQVVAVIESMKMEITIEAPADGVVTAVFAKPGDSVRPGSPLLAWGGAH